MQALHFRRAGWQVRAAWKFLASFFKDEWTIDDYPICYRSQPTTPGIRTPHVKDYAWVSTAIHWPAMSGYGNTRSEALEDLRRNFTQFKAANRKLPRPGSKTALELASRSRIEQHAELANDFIQRVLELEWAWISDESSLWDFHSDETNDRLNGLIRQIYGVDVSDISSGNIADIFERIAKSGHP
jgi:hypothetical protein